MKKTKAEKHSNKIPEQTMQRKTDKLPRKQAANRKVYPQILGKPNRKKQRTEKQKNDKPNTRRKWRHFAPSTGSH